MRARELLRSLDDLVATEPGSAGLAAGIGELVRRGRLPAGTELPSERDLATALDRSRGTVARAYGLLRAEGLAHTRHGAGTTIGCCAGPWASSRAAELEPVVPLSVVRGTATERVIDLRWPEWGMAGVDPGGPGGLTGTPPHDPPPDPIPDPDLLLEHVARPQFDEIGLTVGPEGLVPVSSVPRALDVALSTLLRPGERVLVPELTDPRLLALLRVRGLHPVGLAVTRSGAADIPAWLARIRSRTARVAVVPTSYGAPAGTVLADHERRLLVEAATSADVTLLEDLQHTELWTEQRPPAPLAGLDSGELTVALGATAPAAAPGAGIAWLHSPSGALTDRLRAVAATLDAGIAGPVLAAAVASAGQREAWLGRRRQHLRGPGGSDRLHRGTPPFESTHT